MIATELLLDVLDLRLTLPSIRSCAAVVPFDVWDLFDRAFDDVLSGAIRQLR